MALQPGEILDGKYRIVRPVGEGGMGAVYEGENTRIKRRVAIKVLHSAVAEKQDVVQRFEREAQAAGRIGSEHIVEVLDLGNLPSGERYMVMEFLDGEDVTQRIKRLGRLTPEQAVPLLIQVLEGLAAAHDAGIVHRDLKPDNIYILNRHAGRPDFVKLLDFGVSKFSALDNEMSMTRTGAVMGTPYYMSPEQAKGAKIDARSDLYAIGVVAYQMVTGRVPFNAGSFNELLFKIVLEQPEPLEQAAPGLDPGFVSIVYRAMAREPEARFQSARDFQFALRAWQPHLSGYDVGATMALPDAIPAPRASQPSVLNTSGSFAPQGFAAGPPSVVQPPLAPVSLPQANPLALSQGPLALTPTPSNGSKGTKIALGLVAIALLGALGFGAYLLGSGAPRTASEPSPSATATPATTTEPAPPAAATATASAAATDPVPPPPSPSVEPAASATVAATAKAPALPTTPSAPVLKPIGTGTTKAPTPPAPSANPGTGAAGGRKIKTDL